MTPTLPNINFTWRATDDAQRVLDMHILARSRCPPGMVRPDELSHFEHHMGPGGHTLGCFLDSGEMVAYGVLGLQSPTAERMALLLGLDPARMCVLDGTASLPAWRGYGLHYEAIGERMRLGTSFGRTVFTSTVSPENIRSIRGLFRSGLEVRGFAPMFGGLMRLLVHRDMLQPPLPGVSEMRVLLADHGGHRAALDAGLRGYACDQDASGAWLIDYGR